MKHVRSITIGAALIAAICLGARGFAQTDAGRLNQPAGQSEDAAPSPVGESDQTLEIAPRAAVPPASPMNESPSPESTPAPDNGTAPPGNVSDSASASPGNAGASDNMATNHQRPYLGASVQYIYSDDTPGRVVQGFEVVSVDSKSPAERAGLHGRGAMTKVGATGATAGALAPPLDLVLMPLLRKAGSLGETGDLIIAIDDRRVQSQSDLGNALDSLRPGDTVYFTIARTMPDNSHKTLKVPVKLGESPAVSDTSGESAAASSAANAARDADGRAQSR